VEELAAATADFFTANAGTWTVSEGEYLLIQEFDAALGPDNEGAIFRSGISLSGDELRLVSGRPLPSGEKNDVLYRRQKETSAPSQSALPQCISIAIHPKLTLSFIATETQSGPDASARSV